MEQPGYAGEDIGKNAEIIRDSGTKRASLHMDCPGEWSVFSGPTVERIDLSSPLLEGTSGGWFSLDVPDSIRSYFQVLLPEGRALLAERHLPMTGGYNFRDMGGYRTRDGRYVRWGVVFRSDDMHRLTDPDLRYLESIPLRTIADFRSDSEIESAPDRIPSTVTERFEISINPGNIAEAIRHGAFSPEKMERLMVDINRQFVTDPECLEQYRNFFTLLQSPDRLPVLFHCSAGKDRTGMAAALFLFSLGVPDETVMEDYMASNLYLGDKYSQYISEYPELKPLFEVSPVYLRGGLDEIGNLYGSVENFLTGTLDVDLDRMRELYLYSR